MIRAEGLEDKVSPSTPKTSLSERSRPKAPYSSSVKSTTWTLQPETGQHMEYAGNVTQKSNEQNNAILHAYMADGKLYGYSFA